MNAYYAIKIFWIPLLYLLLFLKAHIDKIDIYLLCTMLKRIEQYSLRIFFKLKRIHIKTGKIWTEYY
jgi:hypothetical protein